MVSRRKNEYFLMLLVASHFSLVDFLFSRHYALPNTPKGLGVVEPELVCESGDMDCFFLPLSPCPPWNKTFKMEKGDLYEKGVLRKRGRMYRQIAYWLLDYAKRPLHWLRKRVHDFVANQTVTPPCTTMHVRRGDITLDKGRRRFYPIEDYVKAAPNIHDTVFLVTDDANAIGEAKYKFPNITWQYIDRPRYHGSEAGFKKHTPSGGKFGDGGEMDLRTDTTN